MSFTSITLLTFQCDEIFPNIPINFSALEYMTLLKLSEFIRLWIEGVCFSKYKDGENIKLFLVSFGSDYKIDEHPLKCQQFFS